MLAVLPFELAIEARISRRPMQHQHLMFLEDLFNERRVMRARPIGTQDEWRAVIVDVALKRAHDECCIVVLAQGDARTVRYRRVRAHERVAL